MAKKDIFDGIKENIMLILKKNYKLNDTDLKKYTNYFFDLLLQNLNESFSIGGEVYQDLSYQKKLNDPFHNNINGFLSNIYNILFFQSFGDTLGYRNGKWEFNNKIANAGPEYANEMIADFISLGGVNDISLVNWRASDDTILYLATFKTLIANHKSENVNNFGKDLRLEYLKTIKKDSHGITQMDQRAPGEATLRSLEIQENIEWNKLPYNSKDIGNGSCMRSGCVGIFFCGEMYRDVLIKFAIESSRITHNSTIAILGSVTSALFTAFGLEKIKIEKWPHLLLNILRGSLVDDYLKKSRPLEYDLYQRDKVLYIGAWEKYIDFRFDGYSMRDIRSMKNPVERIRQLSEKFSKSHLDNPGGTADDACIMAYDALLESGGIIEKLIFYSILHHGDSDTVGSIAFSWYGAYYFKKRDILIMENRFIQLEFYNKIIELLNNHPTFADIFITQLIPSQIDKLILEKESLLIK